MEHHADQLSRGELLAQLTALKSDFDHPKFEGYCGKLDRNHRNEIIDFRAFPPAPELPPGQGSPLSEAEQLAMIELDGLFNRAGHLLEAIPKFGAKQYEVQEAIERCERGKCRWAVLVHRFRQTVGPPPAQSNVVEGIAPVCATVVGRLIASVTADNEAAAAIGDPRKIEFQYQDLLLTARRVENCFLLDGERLYSTSNLNRWETRLPKHLKSAGDSLEAAYFGERRDRKKAYKAAQILAISQLLEEQSNSASRWTFDPDGMASRDG